MVGDAGPRIAGGFAVTFGAAKDADGAGFVAAMGSIFGTGDEVRALADALGASAGAFSSGAGSDVRTTQAPNVVNETQMAKTTPPAITHE